MRPLISVLMPVKNGVKTIGLAISSILDQSFGDFEFLVMDNGSDDGTGDFVRNYFPDLRIKVYSNQEASIVKALNRGISLAKGVYIARMDADDYCHRDRFLRQVEFLNEHSEVAVLASCVHFKTSLDKACGLERYVDWTNSLVTQDEIFMNRFIESPIIHPSTMIRLDSLKTVGGYRQGEFPEDYELWLRFLDHQMLIAKLPDKLLTWVDHCKRLTRTDSRYYPENFYQMKARYIAKWIKESFLKPKEIYVWGAGRRSKPRALYLEYYGVNIRAFIDVDRNKIIKNKESDKYEVIFYEDIDCWKDGYVLIYVSNYGAREQIQQFLLKLGKQVVRDYLFCA